jgi:hypothetical protein
MLVLVKNILMKRKCETVRCRDATASSSVSKVRGEVFAHFHAIAVKRYSSTRNWLFGMPGRILYEQFPWCQRKWWACSFVCFSPVTLFRSALNRVYHSNTRVWLMLSWPNACLIIVRSIALFPRFARKSDTHSPLLCLVSREIAWGQIHDSK